MTKGSPDPQHELMITGLARCLMIACPHIDLYLGKVIPDLELKPDIFAVHSDGRRWAYEMVNQNADAGKIEIKHHLYGRAGVPVYWILWEDQAPGGRLDADKITKQSIWATEDQLKGRRRYRLNKLQQTLVGLGRGRLYTFSLGKPLLDEVDHWLFKLFLIGLDIYQVSSGQLGDNPIEGYWEFIPLPYLAFNEEGQPQLKPGAGELASSLAAVSQPLTDIPTDRPFLLKDRLQDLDDLLSSPGRFQTLLAQSLLPVLKQKAAAYSAEELQKIVAHMPDLAEAKAKLSVPYSDPIDALRAWVDFVDSFPPLVRDTFREVIPLPGATEVCLMVELKQWLEDDPHLQRLLATV